MNILDPLGTRSSALTSLTSPRPLGSMIGGDVLGTLAGQKQKLPPRSSAPASPVVAPTAAGAAAGSSTILSAPPPVTFNPDEDPVVQLVKAAGQRGVQQAQSAELAGRKQTMIDYGYDPSLDYPDASTAEAAKQNPFSFLANLKHNYDIAGHNLDESLNKSNLFYSGYRGQQLGELARNNLGQQASGYGSLRKVLGQLNQAVLDAGTKATDDELYAKGQAYDRYVPPETVSGGTSPAADAAAAPSSTPAATPFPIPPSSPVEAAIAAGYPVPTSSPVGAAVTSGRFPVPTSSPLAPFVTPSAQTTEQLPISTGQPLDDQILADLARVRRRR